MNLFKKFKQLVKLPVADVSQHKNLNDKTLPVADISHHRKEEDKKTKLSESITDWVNDEKSKNTSDSLESLQHEHGVKLTHTHKAAVDAYVTGGLEDEEETGSRRINNHLIESHKSGNEPTKHFEFGKDRDTGEPTKTLHLDHLDDAIKQNKLNKSLTTYSGISFDPRHIMDERHVLHLPAYTSSSTERRFANMYAFPINSKNKHILKITHPKGSTGLYIGDNEDLSPFYQREHLSPRNMKLSINPEPEIINPTKQGGKILHIWHAKRLTK